MVMQTHHTLYKISRILSKIAMIVIPILCIIVAIVLFCVQLQQAGWILLASAVISVIVLYVPYAISKLLEEDIVELNKTIENLKNRETITQKKVKTIVTAPVVIDEPSIEEEKKVVEGTQQSETPAEVKVEEEQQEELPVKEKIEIKIDDVVKVKYDVTKNGKLIKQGTIGKVDNRLMGSSGRIYIVIFKNDETEYRFNEDELELK